MHTAHKITFYTLIVYTCCLFALPSTAFALNSGFVNGIWYSNNPFFAGQTVRVYTVIYNNNPFDIRGVVEFKDGAQIIGANQLTILSGRTGEAWVDWTAAFGEHQLSASVNKAEKLEIGKTPIPMEWTNSVLADQPFVDIDTDGDGIGDRTDPDDDNDDISDEKEAKNGTNPLISDDITTPTTNQTSINPLNNLLSGLNTLTSNSSSVKQLVGGEKISSLANGVKILQEINTAGSAFTAKISDFLAKQKEKPTPTATTENMATGTLNWQDSNSTGALIDKIYGIILNSLLWLLRIPPLLLTIGFVILALCALRLWFKWRRWRYDRY